MIKKLKKLAEVSALCRKLIYFGFRLCCMGTGMLYRLLWFFPIQRNKIVFSCMKGKRFGDSPKYITDQLLMQPGDYDIVWLLKEEAETELPDKIRRIPYGSLRMYYELATARVWVDSNLKFPGIKKRKHQLFVQTWHGSYGLKKMFGDLDPEKYPIDIASVKANSGQTDLMLANSRFMARMYRRAFFYQGKILLTGLPKNDMLLESADLYRRKIRDYYQISTDHCVLYAPTYRNSLSTEAMNLDFQAVLQALSRRFGGTWTMLVRLHPYNLEEASQFISYSKDIINVSSYSVMQDLLAASDVLISDYSSCMFDFITNGKPCFIFATDIEDYQDARDFYFDIHELPFPLAENSEALTTNIENFDEREYQEKWQELKSFVGLRETGHASLKIAGMIVRYMERVRI